MGILDSSTISITNLEPTTSTLSGNVMPGTTTMGASTTTGALWTIDRDKDGNKEVNPKKLTALMGTTAASSTTTSLSLSASASDDYVKEAAAMEITEEHVKAVNQTRNIEEWFESLSDEQQIELLASVDQKLAEVQHEGKEAKHL